MKIQFLGAAGTVTGSCFMLFNENIRFLVDCGMFQGSKEIKERNYGSFPFNPGEIDFVLLTHAHVDHCGLIPKLYKKGFRGPIYTTVATKELCHVVLPDSAYIQETEVERKNRKYKRSGLDLLEPIYTVKDANACLKLFVGCSYEEEIEVAPGIKVRFRDAGHILGSAIIEVCVTEEGIEEKFVFSGDIGNINQPIIDDPTIIKRADVLVMESTYGNRYHLRADNKLDELVSVVKSTMKKGGNLIIPSFAVERTQDLIFYLSMLQQEGKLPALDIYIDSPMAVEATKVFLDNHEFCTDEVFACLSGQEARKYFEGPNVHYVVSTEESIALNKIQGGAIIISASGMADAGRIKHHLKHNLWRPESTVLFVGYQAEGTLGRRILDGEKKVRIHGEEIAVKAEIRRIEGFSAHADQKGLIEWLKGFKTKPGKIFLTHGEESSLATLQRVIASELGINAHIPVLGALYDLSLDDESVEMLPTVAKAVAGEEMTEISPAFEAIKEKIENLAKMPGKDLRLLQRLLAQVNEIEREMSKVS